MHDEPDGEHNLPRDSPARSAWHEIRCRVDPGPASIAGNETAHRETTRAPQPPRCAEDNVGVIVGPGSIDREQYDPSRRSQTGNSGHAVTRGTRTPPPAYLVLRRNGTGGAFTPDLSKELHLQLQEAKKKASDRYHKK